MMLIDFIFLFSAIFDGKLKNDRVSPSDKERERHGLLGEIVVGHIESLKVR